MDRKNVWILNHYAGTAISPSTRHYDLGRELIKRGHSVTIFAAGFHHQKFVEERLSPGESWRIEDHDGVRFVWIRTFPYRGNEWRRAVNMLSFFIRSVIAGMRLSENPDVVIGSSVHPLAVVAAYLLSKVKRSRFMFEVRDLWPQTLIDMGALRARGPVARLLRALERFLYRRADTIITLLPYAHEYIVGLGIPRERIVWIPNGADLTRYDGLHAYDGGSPARFTVMYLGAHGRANALHVILEAAAAVKRKGFEAVRFVFVGDGPEKESLVAYAAAQSLMNVEFRPAVPKNELFKVMGEADAFVFNLEDLPLFKYGISSNKLFDYLASGRPVVFSGNTANNPVKESGAGLSVPANSPELLADAIISLMRLTPAQRVEIGSNGPAYMRANHTMTALGAAFEAVINAQAVS
jgi:glycosyltransferase involved in cell wall biosynthesis